MVMPGGQPGGGVVVLGTGGIDCSSLMIVTVIFRIGTFFSPIMPAMGVIKLFLVFYVEKVC